MQAWMVFGKTTDHEEFLGYAENFMGWLAGHGKLYAGYENKLWPMKWAGTSPEYGTMYTVDEGGDYLEWTAWFSYTDPLGCTAFGMWAWDSAAGEAVYAWAVRWGFLIHVGWDIYGWA